MHNKTVFGVLMTIAFTMAVVQAHALTITPDDCVTDYPCWTSADGPWEPIAPGWNWNNPKEDEIEVITSTANLDLLYKNNVDDGEEDGALYDLYYDTEYLNTALDPSGALITFEGNNENLNEIISCPECFLLVKDGKQNPVWYLYDIGGWDGIETINLSGFWPGNGAISHVAIFGTPVPEPASMIILGVCFATLAGFRLRKKK